MPKRAAIVGIGQTRCSYESEGFNHKELMYLAAKEALSDAGISRDDITSAFTTSLDFAEGRSLSNQYVLDSIGGVMKPCDLRLGEDGIFGILAGYQEALSKPAQIVVVASVQMASDMHNGSSAALFLTHLESNYVRPVCSQAPSLAAVEYCLAAMEAKCYMERSGVTEEDIARVSVKNRRNALKNPLAANQQAVTLKDVMSSMLLSSPIRSLMAARLCDGACAIVVASGEIAADLTDKPVWISGIGSCSDVWYPAKNDLSKAGATHIAASRAYAMAGIRKPAEEIDVAEVCDRYSFDELQNCEALGLCDEGDGGRMVKECISEINGCLPVNPSGGLLGHGNPLGTAGLMRVAEAALQLRGDAGGHQVAGAEVAVAQGCQWPFRSAGVVVLSRW
ncbi:MAG: hypothetical protein IBX68_01155 [Dehalococcoidia bacterium]|nr:hypothetical protein [Dehalococcoidia bacterium]